MGSILLPISFQRIRITHPCLLCLVIVAYWSFSAWAQDRANPTLWMGPPSYDNGKCFRELFEKPDAWKETRSEVWISTAWT
jgi:hypothetical protein